MQLLIIDTETTGTEETDSVCEIAATLYQIGGTERETGAIASISTLIPVGENLAESINGITPELTQIANSATAIAFIQNLAESANYCVAFNAEFDASKVNKLIGEQHWLCAMRDFDWGYPNPNKYGGFKLIDLALWLGIGVSTVHRAADDVRLLVECFNRRKKLLPQMIELANSYRNSPLIELQAIVSFETRRLAKSAGFIWDSSRRIWVTSMRELKADKFISALSFEVQKLPSK